MNDFLKHPWVRVLLIATTVAMCSWALRETASITLPIISALSDVLVPVAIGFCIAYVLTPIVDVLHHRWKLPRTIAAGVPFVIFLLVVVIGTALVVPTVIRQSSSLATRLFQGETFVDVNHNGRYDEGEPYTDSNGNNRYDGKGMFDAALDWVKERQDKLRSVTGLEVDDPTLAKLAALNPLTISLRLDEIHALMIAAQQGAPQDQWPATAPERSDDASDGTWSPTWPGATPAMVTDAASHLPAELRPAWLQRLVAKGRSTARTYVIMAALIRASRLETGAVRSEDLRKELALIQAPLPASLDTAKLDQELTDAMKRMASITPATITAEQLKAAKALIQRLTEQELAGQTTAKLLLTELRGGETSTGARWLAPMIESLEASTKDLVDTLPKKIGTWAKESVSSVDWFITFGLNLILIPIYAFFLILAMQNVRGGVREYLPTWQREKVLRIIRDIELVVAAFFRGRLVVCLLCAIATWIGFIAIGWFGTGVPYAALFALLIGLATAIPLAGILFLIPAVLLNLLDGGSAGTATAMICVYGVVQGLESLVFTPAILGREVELHPVTLIVAILLCGKLLGVLGLILAVPIAATCRILAREFLWPKVREWAGRQESSRHASPPPSP